jgi:hypothetical protein
LGASPGEAFEDAFESTFLSMIGKESVMPVGYPSIRVLNHNPAHHLWNNNGTWWVHFTVHFDQRKRRVRRSLKTRSLTEAVERRDALLLRISQEGELVPERFSYDRRAIV